MSSTEPTRDGLSGDGSGMCELTNQSSPRGLKVTGAKTEYCSTGQYEITDPFYEH